MAARPHLGDLPVQREKQALEILAQGRPNERNVLASERDLRGEQVCKFLVSDRWIGPVRVSEDKVQLPSPSALLTPLDNLPGDQLVAVRLVTVAVDGGCYRRVATAGVERDGELVAVSVDDLDHHSTPTNTHSP